MIQPLNYTPKAIADLLTQLENYSAIDRRGLLYIVEKLRAAQVFLLPDYGQLLDRSKPRPVVPEIAIRPPFPVTSVEFAAPADLGRTQGEYTEVGSSRRIALAWRWEDDFPHKHLDTSHLAGGTAVASICWLDKHASWQIMPVMAVIPADGAWTDEPIEMSPFLRSALAHKRATMAQMRGSQLLATPLPLFPQAVSTIATMHGAARVEDALIADIADEMNAYLDMCAALACRNVSVDMRPAPKVLNRTRARKGKPQLLDTHVLKLADVELGATGASGDRSPARQHLRRGHIRRLATDRITWVNQTMVRGHGYVEKVYAL